MTLYVNSNAEVIWDMIRLLDLPHTSFDYVIDRKARTITSDVTGRVWSIPDDWNLA